MKDGADWYKRYPKAYLGGVGGFNMCEHAVFSVVLDLIYHHGSSINNDPKFICGYIKGMGKAKVENTIKDLCEKGKLSMSGDQITQKRATNEAQTKENLRKNAQRNGRKGGEKTAELRLANYENNDLAIPPATHDAQLDKIREDNKKNDDDAGASASADQAIYIASVREQILEVIGVNLNNTASAAGIRTGDFSDMEECQRWLDLPGMNPSKILDVIRNVMSNKNASNEPGPPQSFKYFNQAMQRASGEGQRPSLKLIEGGHDDQRTRKPGRDPRARGHGGLAKSFRKATVAKTKPSKPID